MTYRLLMLAALYIPLVGLAYLSKGAFAQGLGQGTGDNGATYAYMAYCFAFVSALILTESSRLVRQIGSSPRRNVPGFKATAAVAIVALASMAIFVLLAAGGINTFLQGLSAGEFRIGLGGTGAIAYLILKYYSPVVITILLLVANHHRRIFSWQVILASLLHMIIAMSFGYKSAIIMAMLPPCILLLWNAHWSRIFGMGVVGFVILVVAYIFMKPPDQASLSPIEAVFYRTFALNAEVPWKVWDTLYREGKQLPPYIDTLPALLGDRIFSSMTGITRADPEQWANTHFSVFMTTLGKYDAEYVIMNGHNNAANIFSEGLMAGGIIGMLAFGFMAGAFANMLCYLIENRLAAQDYGAAAVGSAYFIFAFIAWMLGGGVVEILHVAVLFGVITAFIGARAMMAIARLLELKAVQPR